VGNACEAQIINRSEKKLLGACEGHPEKFNLPRRFFASMALASASSPNVGNLPHSGLAFVSGCYGWAGTTINAGSTGVSLFLEIEPADA
jgi:hypothetical protein